MPPAPRHLLLLRHGQSVWNAEGRWQGQADPPLSALGERQAVEAAGRLAGIRFTRVVASDLVRARRTAEIIAGELGLGDVRLEAGLREIDVGDWTGLTRDEIHARWPGLLAAWSDGRAPSTPGGETRVHLAERAQTTLARLAAAASPGDRLLVVAHGALIRTLDRALVSEPVAGPNLAGRWYDADDDGTLSAGELVVLVDPEERTASPSP
ncbi:MAG: histidine phosphatase family protein [Actinomycetota bacterium]|nr:histidine phosphatase family protein [Actinomycetota bacterium]